MMQNFLLQVLRLRLMVCGIYIIIMEDYILREIDKIGKLIEALLQKAGILRRSGAGEAVCETAWTELAEALDLDIDTLLAREDFIGVLTRELAKRAAKVLAMVPHELAVLETDCPYMSPEPVRGTRNDSRNIAHVAAKIGEIWQMDAQSVLDLTAENAKRIFNQ